MKTIKIGLIGAGYMAEQHLSVLANIDNVDVTGITSRTLAKASKLANQYKIKFSADSVNKMISHAKPDAILVLVSAESMFNICNELLNHHKLPLFIEKPAGMLPSDTLSLSELADKNGVMTMVGYNRRYYSIFHKGIKIIQKYGKLNGIAIEGHERMWRVHGSNKFSDKVLENWLYVNSTHTIDLLRFFGGEPYNVSSIVHSNIERRGDQISAIMEFDSGAIGNYIAHWYSPGGWKVVLYGDGVTVEFKPLENGRWLDKDFNITDITPDDVDVKFKFGLYRQMESFVKMVRKGSLDIFALDLFGAYRTMSLAKKIFKLS